MTGISATGRPDRFRASGFTLVEILVVLAIATALAASLSLGGFGRQASLKNQVDDIALNLQLLRQRAQLEGKSLAMSVDVAANRFVFPDQEVALGPDIDLTVTGAQRQLAGDAVLRIAFFPDGSSSGGVIRIEREQEQYEISVIWISGKITVRQNAPA